MIRLESVGHTPILNKEQDYFLDQLGKGLGDLAFTSRVQAFLNLLAKKVSLDDVYTSILLHEFLSPNMLVAQSVAIQNLIIGWEQTIPEVREYIEVVGALQGVVEGFFARGCNQLGQPFDFWLPEVSTEPMIVQLLNLHQQRIINERTEFFRKKGLVNYLVEQYKDPKEGTIGLWMSTQGVHFNPKLLKIPQG